MFEQYKLAIGNALLKDEAFVNACCNSDRQNAYLEGAEAIRRIVTASDDLQLTRLYFDMPAFHDQLHQELLDEIYPTLATAAIPSHSQVTQADIDAKQKKHEPEQNPDYQLLSRLKADCDYFLGAGGRAEKHLWAGSVRAQIAKMREIYETLPAKPEWLTKEAIDDYDKQMTPQYQVVVYHHFENGFDEKLEYQTLEEAIKVAQGYVNGTMESDGFAYDGAAVYHHQEHRYLYIYGHYPD